MAKELGRTRTKTWKLGEVCQGGIITVQTNGHGILIHGKEWDYSKGSNKGSDQSQAKIFTTLDINATDQGADSKVEEFLTELTSSYHAEQIAKWIEGEVNYTHRNFF